ncbi:hypothetical protein LIA77_01653 [Sarocladium implicatum]|nr:hypothetical protein LIA77_01653 [Sarocladium implicatum]
MDSHANFRQESIQILQEGHRCIVDRAITRTLSTEIAEETYAQIVDGLPIGDVIFDTRGLPPPSDHPMETAHDKLCDGVLEETRKFYQAFDLDTLKFDSRLLLSFQAAGIGSRVFNTRLLEILAVTVHDIAVQVYKLDTNRHSKDGIIEWEPPKSNFVFWDNYPDGALPTLFRHPWYEDYDQYPNGVADMVGYWAENRIIGGVTLFNRGQRQKEDLSYYDDEENDEVYLHPDRGSVSYRIFQLLPQQKQALISFLTSENPPEKVPIPLKSSEENRVRVDPEDSIRETGIYRDLWERKDVPDSKGDFRLRDCWSHFDYPTDEDRHASYHKALERRRRIDYGPDWERRFGEEADSND